MNEHPALRGHRAEGRKAPPYRLRPKGRSFAGPCAVALLGLLAGAASTRGELAPELSERVRALVEEVERAPTTAENGVERMATLWDWANARSLADGFVPKNLPLAAAYIPNPPPGEPPSPFFLAQVDTWTRQLALLERDPAAFGSARVEAPARFAAGSVQTLRVRYEVGSLGIAPGGAILVSRHMFGGYGGLQTDDPRGDGYVTIASNQPETRFETASGPVFGPYGGFRAQREFPAFRVRGQGLRPGAVVTITYGDRSSGGRGLEIGTYSNSAINLPLFVDPGPVAATSVDGITLRPGGRFYEIAPATFEIVGAEAADVHGFAPSIVGVGEDVEISVRTEDRYTNRATGGVPTYRVTRNGEPWGRLEARRPIQLLRLRLDEPGVHRFAFESEDGRVRGVANPIWVRQSPKQRIWWGETHGHCGFAEGQGTPEAYFAFARDDARLDFVTLSEHDIWLTDGEWRTLNREAERHLAQGDLVVFPGYEWSATRARGGHHNVFFRRPGMARVSVHRAPDLALLYHQLRTRHPATDVLIIPHAHQAADWRQSDPHLERLVEIMSSHGTFEWFGRRYLERGHQVGFVAASDDHLGHPGYAPGHPGGAGRRSNIFQFGGLAGVLAESGDSDQLFDALRARHTYATSGSQRIVLDARLDGQAFGSAVPATAERRIEGRAIGTAPIRRIALLRNGELVEELVTTEDRDAGPVLLVSFESESWVRFRDNPRGHRTWRGELEVRGATVAGARLLGTPDATSDRLAVDGSTIRFDVATRGSRRVLAIDLGEPASAPALVVRLEPTRERGTAPPQRREPQRFAARSFVLAPAGSTPAVELLEEGPYRDRVTAELERAYADDVRFRFEDRGGPDDWYTLRVEQIDGHMAWSSPWWVGTEPPR